ncbi:MULTISPECIES: bifunctional adenosylcobinamide kinase/adenosylcobinamide-phosphate guanylyltransferase [unclassified Synechococcus]|uniref:bifunctional adenosylcobinamide kinase/adenosylcobinamide-phosphate guanylyltransferase n=1 Tax=unclassified Synechococcus TaxID=2626047 RepID=UPI002AD4E7DB|nr:MULTISPECIES: bifunctional adenosylcobinamide kinase/adenosylcobinamide-phosphate guanylyltransferase [unclassified Synechococcus]
MRGCLTLVSGPSSGGKSRWAEHLAARSGRQVVYLATGPSLPEDPAWQQRLALHRRRRPSSWQNREVGRHLAEALQELGPDQLALVDSLGTWVAAGLDWDGETWETACAGLLEAIGHCAAPVVLVCEEVGWGVVPPTAIGGLFRDRQGRLQQRLMALCTGAWLVLQGRAVDLLALSQPVPELLEP